MSKLTKIKVVQVGNVSKGEGYFHAFVEDSHDAYGNAETVAEAIGQLVWEIRNKLGIVITVEGENPLLVDPQHNKK